MPKKTCLPCALHDGLTDEEATMLYRLLSHGDDYNLEEAFFIPMMDLMTKELRKLDPKAEISSGGMDGGTLDKRFAEYTKVYKKFVTLLKGKGGRVV